MDILSVTGILLSIAALLLGNFLHGGEITALFNIPALIIVFGGTLGAALLQFPPVVFTRSLKIFLWILKPAQTNLHAQIDKLVGWSMSARKEGLLGLENEMSQEQDPFIQKALQLLVDGNEPEVIRDTLEVELNIKENRDLQAAKLFAAMGGYAPTIGIIGAVMGLIHVMQNLANPELLGDGIATAFVATIYGVASANLFFLPVANKLKHHIMVATQAKEMMIVGIIAIAEGENPRNIELKLAGFLHDKK
jgi:chemotaxis protein MotA